MYVSMYVSTQDFFWPTGERMHYSIAAQVSGLNEGKMGNRNTLH
jgi:hypothetical protein